MTTAGTPLQGRPWLQTHRGLAWCADAPEAYPYDIEEIAHALSHLNRFAGHAKWGYSVLHHSLLVGIEVELHTSNKARIRAALIHDAAEAFTNDVTSPVRRMPGMDAYNALVKRTEEAIAKHFGVLEQHAHPAIKHADYVLLATEKRDVLGPSPHDKDWAPGLPSPRSERICEMTPADVRTGFLTMWKDVA